MYSSGNEITDKVGQLNIVGNIVPAIWYKRINRDNGKPYLLAISILSDIVYWYRPTEIRDEATGQLIGYKKKYKGDYLLKSYQNYADFFGESKRSVKAAMDRLEELKLIKRIFRDEEHNGRIFTNVMYISLDPEVLYNITFESDNGGIQLQQSMQDMQENNTDIYLPELMQPEQRDNEFREQQEQNIETSSSDDSEKTLINNITDVMEYPPEYPPTKFCNTLPQNFVVPSHKILQHPPTKLCNYTKIIKENNNIYNSINQSPSENDGLVDKLVHQIKENLEYDLRMLSEDGYMTQDQKILENVCTVMCDVICETGRAYNINNVKHSYEDVRDRFLEIDYEHAMYAANQVIKSSCKISNLRSYLIAALYNSVTSMQLAINKNIQENYGYG